MRHCFQPGQNRRASTQNNLSTRASRGRGCFRLSRTTADGELGSRAAVSRERRQRRIELRRSPMTCDMAACYRKRPVDDKSDAVDFKGGRNFGDQQPASLSRLWELLATSVFAAMAIHKSIEGRNPRLPAMNGNKALRCKELSRGGNVLVALPGETPFVVGRASCFTPNVCLRPPGTSWSNALPWLRQPDRRT